MLQQFKVLTICHRWMFDDALLHDVLQKEELFMFHASRHESQIDEGNEKVAVKRFLFSERPC